MFRRLLTTSLRNNVQLSKNVAPMMQFPTLQTRCFSTTPVPEQPATPTVKPAADREAPKNFRALWFTLIAGLGGYAFLKYRDTDQVANTKVMTYQVAGKLELGGPFSGLIDQDGKPASSDQYIGKYPLMYFGFTHCPDICPTELKKMMLALDRVEKEAPDVYAMIKPIFISVDPLRDTIPKLKSYSKEYHPRIRWLTGPYDKLLEVAKKYRVYFSIPDDVTADDDYNVDHSIFFFLMDKQGQMLNYYGQNMTADEVAKSMIGVVRENMNK